MNQEGVPNAEGAPGAAPPPEGGGPGEQQPLPPAVAAEINDLKSEVKKPKDEFGFFRYLLRSLGNLLLDNVPKD